MEYERPAENGPSALRELSEFIGRKKTQVHFPVEYRYVKGDDIWLSPFYGRDTAAISVHQYQGMDYREYFAGAEAIFRNHGGRPHWGKIRSEEHTSELQSLMRISYAVFCLKKKMYKHT